MLEYSHYISDAGIRAVQFQSEGDDSLRHYLEVLACQTETPNDQNYLFLPESATSVVESYSEGQPCLVNHFHYGQSGIGYGATVSARYEAPNIYITAYLMKGKTTPMGPFGTTDELIDAVLDGSLKDVSVKGEVEDAECSICGMDYHTRYYHGAYYDEGERCSHYRGGRYPVKQSDGSEVLETCIVKIKKFSGWELSFVWNGSDDKAVVVNRNLQMAALSGSPMDTEKQSALSKIILSSHPEPNPQSNPNPQPTHTGGGLVNDNVATLTAEKNALTAQVSAKDTEIAALTATKTDLEGQVTAKNQRITELEAQVAKNEQSVKDGEFAREKAIDACVEAFAKTELDTPADELKVKEQEERKSLETLSLEQISNREAGYVSFAEKINPTGRQTKTGAEAGSDPAELTKKRPRRTGVR